MKKINKVSVASRSILASRYFKVLVVFLLIIMVIMSAVLIKVYVDINKKEIEKKSSAKSIIIQMDKSINDYTVFEDENGLLGVSEKDEHIIIEPFWNDIYILSENRFIVSKMFEDEKKMGIIDCESNILVPFIFNTFKSFCSDLIGGFTGNNNDFFLFDKSGNILSDKVWTNYKYDNKIMYLENSGDKYRCCFTDEGFRFVYVNIRRTPEYIPYNIILTDREKIEKIGVDNINRIADITSAYLEYLISGNDAADITDITSEQYYSSLSSNDFFKDCRVKKLSDFSINILEDKSSVSYNAKIIVNYDYSQKNVDFKNISSEIKFNIVRDENNRLILKSINKTEL